MRTYSEAAGEFTELFDVLASDVRYLRELHARGDGPKLRRHYVRASMATLEGVTYAFKQMALAAHNDGMTMFTEKEIEKLTEQKLQLNEQGVLVPRPHFSSILPNIKFAFKALARSHGLPFKLPTGEAGWQEVSRAVSIRNRITHPKLAVELSIDDEEFHSVEVGQRWFMSQAQELSKQILEVSQRRVLAAKAEIARGEAALSNLEQERAAIEERSRSEIDRLALERDSLMQRSKETTAELERQRRQVIERGDAAVANLQRESDALLDTGNPNEHKQDGV